ncbi:alpha/beta fold hydrolase [Nocardioides sp.]|uniref:alpha/beta fold hydrolase n=1 Tax=Nocardioides sp. TaxID=35761 RepID=UPI002734DAE6|nr:alpha/beta fold hydrolase [Nocardioides sp.]MDP3891304.1 alpha/beta fold hydrolase [Nocardioides sp.]
MSRALVLLHGVGLDHTMWEPLRSLLPSDLSVVAPDLPGHGAYPPPHRATSLAELADAIVQEVPPGAHLVGFSLGALIAQHLAIHRPELVGTITSVSSVCRRTPQERTAVLARLDLARRDFPASVEASIERWYAGTGTPDELVARTRTTLLANDPDSFRSCYRVFATADGELGPLLGDITAPALAVTGELDPGSTPQMAHRLADAVPDGRVVVVPGARHMLPVQDPEALASCLTDFLQEQTIGEDAHV